MRATEDEEAEAIRRVDPERDAVPATYRVAPEMGLVHARDIQGREDFSDAVREDTRRGVAGLIAQTLAPGDR
jgi:hypothetical protein